MNVINTTLYKSTLKSRTEAILTKYVFFFF